MTEQRVILMVEDDRKLMGMNKRMLELLGYEVRTAVSLASAREILKKRMPDCIVLDVRLGFENGLDLCREVRAASDVPVLFLTGLGRDSEVVAGFEAGGDDYVVKPVNVDVLAARIDALLRRAGKKNASMGNTGDKKKGSEKTGAYVEIDEEKFASLTAGLDERDKEIARLVALGLKNHEIAAKLSYSLDHVKKAVSRIYIRTGLSNRANFRKMFTKTGEN